MKLHAVNTVVTLMLAGCVAFGAAEVLPLEAHYRAARAALARGDTNKAKRELKLSLQENPLDAEAHFLLASLLGREGDLDQAAVGYQETVKLAPNNAVARYNLGTTMLRRGETLPAARLLEEAVAIHPDYVPAYNNLAKAYFLAGIPELSVASYQEALSRDPSNPIARKGLTLLTQAGGGQVGSGAPAVEPKPPVEPPSPVTPAQAAVPPDADDAEAQALREIVRDLMHVTVERRGDRLTLAGWTSGVGDRKILDRILAGRTNVLDLTTEDAGDPQRLLEVDAIIFYVLGLDSKSLGHDFLRRVNVNASIADAANAGFGWLYSAAISYEVNIANATQERVAFLARPHLTALSGTPATFIAGGDTVYKVSGTTSGDIKVVPVRHEP